MNNSIIFCEHFVNFIEWFKSDWRGERIETNIKVKLNRKLSEGEGKENDWY